MFLLNSRYRHFTAAPSRSTGEPLHANRALLLPKLRSKFAEFLNESSLKRLRILTLPTCVGFGTVITLTRYEVFLGSMGSTSLWSKLLLITSQRLNWENGFANPPRLQA